MFDRLKEVFKKLIIIEKVNTKEVISISNQEFNDPDNLKFGTIVWAKRYKTEQEALEMPDGHRTGPFVLIGYNKKGYIALYGSSKEPKSPFANYRILSLFSEQYRRVLKKNDTYIDIAKVHLLTEKQIIDIRGELIDLHKEELLKKIGMVEKQNMYTNPKIKAKKVPISKRDIFSKDGKIYLVVNVDEKGLTCLELIKSDKSDSTSIDGIKYQIIYEPILFKNKDIDRYTIMDEKTYKMIGIRYEYYLQIKDDIKIIKRGSLVTCDNILYYVYGEITDCFQAFAVYEEKYEPSAEIIINGRVYYTDFSENITFYKSDKSYEGINIAFPNEMENIKTDKKHYMKTHPKDKKKTKVALAKPNITPGTIVEDIGVNNTKYVVLQRTENQLILWKKKSMEKFDYALIRKGVSEVNFVETMHPITFRGVLEEISENEECIRGFISKDNMRKLLKEHK